MESDDNKKKMVDNAADSTDGEKAGAEVSVVETQGFDEARTRKLLRKLDWHIIPFMSLIYLYEPLLPSPHQPP